MDRHHRHDTVRRAAGIRRPGSVVSAHGGVAILAVSDDLIAALESSSRVPPSGGRSMTHGILLHKLSRSSRSPWLPTLASAGPID
jgi:hypothetical protein